MLRAYLNRIHHALMGPSVHVPSEGRMATAISALQAEKPELRDPTFIRREAHTAMVYDTAYAHLDTMRGAAQGAVRRHGEARHALAAAEHDMADLQRRVDAVRYVPPAPPAALMIPIRPRAPLAPARPICDDLSEPDLNDHPGSR